MSSINIKHCSLCHHKNNVRSKKCKECNSPLSRVGRPKGTSTEVGYQVGHSGGRPAHTTELEGFSVSPGRPTGTTTLEGYSVSPGRPTGTTVNKGYKVGRSRGRPSNARRLATFLEDLNLPKEWDTSHANLSADLLGACQSRIHQQRTFDRKPLGVGVCYNCGHVLWTNVDGAHSG